MSASFPRKLVVLSASLKTNALGRALVMRDIGTGLFEDVEVYAPPSDRLWVGAVGEPVLELTRHRLHRLADDLNVRAADGRSAVVWISKGYPSAVSLLRLLRRDIPVVADFDDDDIALAREFVSASIPNRIKLNPLRSGSPGRLARSQLWVRERAQMLTSSSFALGSSIDPHGKWVRVPHAREDFGGGAKPVTGFRRIGFLGTVRPHKGLNEICQALTGDARLEFITFGQSQVVRPYTFAGRWHELPPDTPLADAYREVDVAVLPMNAASDGAQRQLPAKAVDAAVMGIPIAAASTPVLDEYFSGGMLQVANWNRLGARLEAAFLSGELNRLGSASRKSWANELALDRVRASLETAIADLFARPVK
ncbi:hypothetical protein RZO50_07060 [Microbacterium sp. SSW1-59]|uniref:hypothetical protein n=1 Tax=Microbacterium xanthum TaxID=3079794 RepID=UPI002AD4F3F8|nr:hypothetical protein [Microbacterium sp. SSW1-59]MDZ8201267.1 hypothetical protein [Microbacterium sp. SSW1-59]